MSAIVSVPGYQSGFGSPFSSRQATMLMPRTCSLSIGTAHDSSVPRSWRFGFRPGLADARDDEHVRHDAFRMAHHAVAVRQVLDHIIAHAEQRKIVAPPNLAKMSGTIRERAIRILE